MQDGKPPEELERSQVVTAPDWTPWGQPRRGAEGVETAFHHPLILLRQSGGAARVVKTADVFVGEGAKVEWSPMPWAHAGRRPGRGAAAMRNARVILGEGERLFTTLDSVCEQFFEDDALGANGLAGWVAALEGRLAFCEARAIVYRHLIIPDSHAVYADAMPGAPRLSERRPLRALRAALSPAMRAALVYPLDDLVDGRAQEETAFPHDVHPTGFGAYLIYRALVRALPGIDPASVVQAENLVVNSFVHAGDVAHAAGLPARRVKMHHAPKVPYKSLIKGSSYKTYQVDVLVGENAALPRAVMFRTSNATQQFPYLMRHFSRLVAVASKEAFFDLIESERPDMVIAEMPERYLANARLNVDASDFGTPPTDLTDAFEQRTGHALPLPQAKPEPVDKPASGASAATPTDA